MKTINKRKYLLVFSVFLLLCVIAASAFTGILKKGNHAKIVTPPEKIDGGPLRLTTSLDNQYYYDNDHVYLYIDLRAEPGKKPDSRTPLNIAIVIDRSGSMNEKKKLEYVKRAVDYILEQVKEDDYVSIVTYNDYVNVLQRSQHITNIYDLQDKIYDIKADGYTNLSEGMFEGYDQVNNTYSRGYVNRVLLLTDGLANRGITDDYELSKKVRDKNRRDGITISTFGVGNDFNENLLTDIADYGKGNYYYINNSTKIPDIFAQELKGVRSLVAEATKVRIKFPTEYLTPSKIYGYPYDISGNEVVIDFKDVFAEQTKSVLIKFDIKKKIDSKINFESDLSYNDVSSDFKEVSENDNQYLQPTTSKDEYTRNSNETVVQNISLFESNQMMEDALKEADNGNYDRAQNILKNAQEYMNTQMGSVQASTEMRQQSDNMDKYSKDLDAAKTKTEDEKKEMQKSGKYDNYNSRKKNQ